MAGLHPQGKVKRAWTPEVAYAVGLLVTDGNLSPDRRHINLTSMDRDQVETFRNCLGLQNAIGRKSRGSGQPKKYYVIQFGDVLFYEWLVSLGMSARKSRTLGRIEIPDEYFFDFLRGCFDGDGSINSYWDLRWPASYMYYLKFSSGSRPYLEWLQETIEKLAGVVGRIQKGGHHGHELVFAKRATRRLLEKMFYSCDVPHLDRKYSKARKILREDEERFHAQVEELADSPA